MIQTPELDFSVLGPIAALGGGAMLVLLLEVFLSRMKSVGDHRIGVYICMVSEIALFIAACTAAVAFAGGEARAFDAGHPMYQLDRFSALVTVVISLGAMLSCGLAVTYLDALRINHGEFYALILLSTAGMIFMVGAVDLIAVFVGLETMSIPIYVLAGFDRRKLRSNESALKYFIIGSFATAVMLYGMALLYGATGATSFEVLHAGFDPKSPLALVGLGLLLVGFAFKISSVPFHQWTPDVYEGAPSVVTAFMSVAVKTAAVATLLRVLGLALSSMSETVQGLLWGLAAATVVVGNLMAVIQDNVKRLLAYSSVAHAGYILIGLVAGGSDGYSAILFYLVAYTLMNLGAFGVIVALAQQGQDCERVDSLAGLAQQRPAMAALMTLFMLSLAGIPGTVGFIGKFQIFMAAARADQIPLAILGLLMSAVSVYYYLRIPVLMYMRDPAEESPRPATSVSELAVLGFCAFFVLYLGIFPNGGWLLPWDMTVLEWARASVNPFFSS